MKKWMFLLLIAVNATAHGQSLKDLLFSGKLKSDSNTVVKRTDDLSTKIDTAQKKVEPEKPKTTPADISGKKSTTDTATAGNASPGSTEAASETAAPATVAPMRTNNKIWKEYSDSLINTMRSDVIANKKVKKDTYFVTVDYETDAEGQVTVTGVTVAPDNAYLQDQLKQRLTLTPPAMNATPDNTGKARKVKRRYNFSIVKD